MSAGDLRWVFDVLDEDDDGRGTWSRFCGADPTTLTHIIP